MLLLLIKINSKAIIKLYLFSIYMNYMNILKY